MSGNVGTKVEQNVSPPGSCCEHGGISLIHLLRGTEPNADGMHANFGVWRYIPNAAHYSWGGYAYI